MKMGVKNNSIATSKLKSQKLISNLFRDGKVIYVKNIRVHYLSYLSNEYQSIKVAYSVPKKHMKRAVDRNKVKRLLRESFRSNGHVLESKIFEPSMSIALIIICTSNTLPTFQEVKEYMLKSLDKIKI